MWVWSDELVERVSRDTGQVQERVPLVAYAVGLEVDLDQLAREILDGSSVAEEEPQVAR
ncbi:MAG: hypothetical protein U9R51_08450 [Actinomycetota bacterium]|nr:hypothetical protein [Actinomycetota bacterium]